MRALVVLAAMVGPTAALAELPSLDIEARCEARPISVKAPDAVGAEALDACLAEEEQARATLLPHWDALPPGVRATCERAPPDTMGPPSYVLLQYCVEGALVQAGQPLPFSPLFFR